MSILVKNYRSSIQMLPFSKPLRVYARTVVGGWLCQTPNNKQQSTHNNPRELWLHVLALVLVYITFYPNKLMPSTILNSKCKTQLRV